MKFPTYACTISAYQHENARRPQTARLTALGWLGVRRCADAAYWQELAFLSGCAPNAVMAWLRQSAWR